MMERKKDDEREVSVAESERQSEPRHATWEDLFIEEETKEDTEMRSRDELIKVEVILGKRTRVNAVVDTGATHTCIDVELYNKLKQEEDLLGELPTVNVKLLGAVGKKRIQVRKQVALNIRLGDESYNLVVLVVEGLFTDMIIGMDWLRINRVR